MATVLVVDDDPDVRQLVEMKLRLDGIETLTATNGIEALDMLEKAHVDLVILDVMMPVMDGIETCSRIRQVEAFADLPVIMLTAKAQAGDIQDGFATGATDYVVKPFSPRELLSRVRGNLARAGIR
jgi:two-component system phosphate regulon response regulator PhoB